MDHHMQKDEMIITDRRAEWRLRYNQHRRENMSAGLTFPHAAEKADRINALGGCKAEVIRILPEDIDPITDGDSGWDVEVTVLETSHE